MAAVVAVGSLTCASISSSKAASRVAKRSSRNGGVRRLSLHGGLKAHNQLTAMGSSLSTEQQFADLKARCNARSGSSGGGALASKCNVASEILLVVPIMSVLVLVGVALGFVLLRIEAAIEESE